MAHSRDPQSKTLNKNCSKIFGTERDTNDVCVDSFSGVMTSSSLLVALFQTADLPDNCTACLGLSWKPGSRADTHKHNHTGTHTVPSLSAHTQTHKTHTPPPTHPTHPLPDRRAPADDTATLKTTHTHPTHYSSPLYTPPHISTLLTLSTDTCTDTHCTPPTHAHSHTTPHTHYSPTARPWSSSRRCRS